MIQVCEIECAVQPSCRQANDGFANDTASNTVHFWQLTVWTPLKLSVTGHVT